MAEVARTAVRREKRCIIFDWGNTLMRDIPTYRGPMVTWPTVETLPYAREVLAELSSQWLLALATNAVDSDEEAIRAALHRGGLSAFFDRIYCSRKVGHTKPSQEFFAYIVTDLRLEPSALVMVGDDFCADVLGANEAGIRAIWLNERTDEQREGTMYQTIHDLQALPRILLCWASYPEPNQ